MNELPPEEMPAPELPPLEAYALDEVVARRRTNGAEAAAEPPRPADSTTDLASQQSVLGALLIGAPWSEVSALVRAEDYAPKYRVILQAIATLAAEGKAHDPVTVAQQLEAAAHVKVAGGLAELSALARNTPTAANVRAYARVVREHAIKRRLPAGCRDADSIARMRRMFADLDALQAPNAPAYYPLERLDCLAVTTRIAVVQGLGLDQATVCAIIGAPNAGKTAFAISLGVHVATGCKDWLGLKLTSGPVLYVGAEAPGSVRMRGKAALEHLSVCSHVAFYITPAVPGLGSDETSDLDAQQVIATVREIGRLEERQVLLLVFDTLASCLGGGAENGDGMVLLTNCAKEIAATTGVCVLLVHHPSKGDAASARGHTSLAAACDTILLVERESDAGEARTATVIKARDHATGARLRFALKPVTLPERDSFGEPLTTVVVTPATGIPVPHKRPVGKNQETLLTDLERQHRLGKTHFTQAEVLESAKALGMADRNRNAPRNALRDLLNGGFLAGSPASYALKFPPAEVQP